MNGLSLLLVTLYVGCAMAQDGIRGVVFDQAASPLANVYISATPSNLNTTTDSDGRFFLAVLEDQTLSFSFTGYAPFVITASMGDLVTISLQPTAVNEDPYQNAQLNIIRLSDDELGDETHAQDNISGLLQATKDVFLRTAAFEFSASFFKVRGMDTDHATVMINGLPMNKLYNGRPQWSNWGGLNDVLRNRELTQGIEPSDFSIGGVLGTTNISTQASGYASGGRITTSSSDRSYNYRVLASYATGPMANGWSAAFALGNRWGASGYQKGTFCDAQSVFIAVEKQWRTHSLNMTLIATPNRRGKSSPNTHEVYDLKGIRYNEYWGRQSGEVRNARVKRLEEPLVMLNHRWKLSAKSTLLTNVGLQFGALGNSRLDFPGGANPSPSYYQKLPSYFLTQNGGPDYEGTYRFKQEFIADGQLDWNRIYDANITNNTLGLPAAYVLYEDLTKDTQWSANTIFSTELNDNIKLIGTIQLRTLTSKNSAEIIDLLGSTGYLNVDPYDGYQYDLNNPNSIVGEGGTIRYNYQLNAFVSEASLVARFNYPKFNGYLASGFSSTTYQRDGYYLHEAYPTSSLGKSKKLSFTGGSLKAGATYKITGKQFVQGNAALTNRAPSLRNSFSNPRENNAFIGEQAGRRLTTERIIATDLSYIFRSPKLSARLTAFFNRTHDTNEVSFFFAEGIGGDTSSFVQEIMHGIDKQHQGIEFGFESEITPSFTLKGAAAIGLYTYANNPHVYLTSDDFEYLDFGQAKMKHLKLSSGPQEAYSLGVEFRENFWWFGITTNYFDHTYLDVSPINRTHNFLLDRDGLPFTDYDPERARILLQQEQFDPYSVVNLVLGKSWRFGNKFLGAFLSVNNLFGATYKTGGFEQSRNANYRELLEDIQAEKRRFGPKYWYGRATTYFLNMNLRF
ncbi:MAG: TonB-dependent receptor [Flavobacteriaceae bacterium]|nr:TonB-dependent receptor [Flavobacteriaceae bacterium]